MKTKEGSTKSVNFRTPGKRGSCGMACPYKSYNYNALLLENSFCQLLGIYQKEYIVLMN